MDKAPNDMTPRDAAAALDWLIAMGADEIIAAEPINRFAAVEATKTVKESARPVQAAQVLVKPAGPVPTGDNADAVAAACQSLAELAAAYDQFHACSLRKTASHTCFLGGDLSAKIMVIGDRPRDDEEREGQVFAGKNAALLDNMLQAIGLSLQSVVLANVIAWRPPGNRPPNEIEVKQCAPFIRRAIVLAEPKLVLGLGGLAGLVLANESASIARQRGKWITETLLSTFHPDELLTSPARKKLAWRDLLMFRARIKNG
jgi:uracil-DNA glycosylase